MGFLSFDWHADEPPAAIAPEPSAKADRQTNTTPGKAATSPVSPIRLPGRAAFEARAANSMERLAPYVA
jgi:hypothetical protein